MQMIMIKYNCNEIDLPSSREVTQEAMIQKSVLDEFSMVMPFNAENILKEM